MRVALAVSSLVGLLAVACGGSVVANSSGGSGTGAGTTSSQTSTSSSSSGAGGGISPAGCPTAAPTAGASCTHDGANCTWGDSVLAECRVSMSCNGGVWVAQTSIQCPMPVGCPTSQPQQQASCGATAYDCSYPNGAVCECSSCPPLGGACMPMPLAWYCQATGGGSGCPTLIPNGGSTCVSAGASCTYPSAGCGFLVTCAGGAWTWQAQGCPG